MNTLNQQKAAFLAFCNKAEENGQPCLFDYNIQPLLAALGLSSEVPKQASLPLDTPALEYDDGRLVFAIDDHLKPGMNAHDCVLMIKEFCERNGVLEAVVRLSTQAKAPSEIAISRACNKIGYGYKLSKHLFKITPYRERTRVTA